MCPWPCWTRSSRARARTWMSREPSWSCRRCGATSSAWTTAAARFGSGSTKGSEMLLKIGAVLAAIPMSLLAVVASTGVVVVDVKEGGPEGHHIVVPVPLMLGEAAAAFVPQKARHLELGEAKRYLPVAEEMLKALEECEDAELVRVDEQAQHVLILKHGPNLEIHVKDGVREQVDVTVPLAMAREVVH